jgi:hypothetical protein
MVWIGDPRQRIEFAFHSSVSKMPGHVFLRCSIYKLAVEFLESVLWWDVLAYLIRGIAVVRLIRNYEWDHP